MLVAVLAVSAIASADIISPTKDLKLGKDGYGMPYEVTTDGDLGVRGYSSGKISSFIGGFDVSGLSGVESATLNLYVVNRGTSSSVPLTARALTLVWDESLSVADFDAGGSMEGVWSSSGEIISGFSTEGEASFNAELTTGEWITIDVTDIVANWVNGTVGSGDAGILVKGGVWNAHTAFGSLDTEGDFAPFLSVTVPEPATMGLLVLGGIGALIRRRR
jgi:hypothetical protein